MRFEGNRLFFFIFHIEPMYSLRVEEDIAPIIIVLKHPGLGDNYACKWRSNCNISILLYNRICCTLYVSLIYVLGWF